MNKAECEISNCFNGIDSNYHRAVYCLVNCRYKCEDHYIDNSVTSFCLSCNKTRKCENISGNYCKLFRN